MRQMSKAAAFLAVSGIIVSSVSVTAAQPGGPGNFADKAFENVWSRTDALVSSGAVKRSYYWGPQAGLSMGEQYNEGQGGTRLVQYFDKGRMEINNPNGDRSNRFFVTNGLLTGELVTGLMQVGNHTYTARHRADIAVAGDTDDMTAPTYASFRALTGRTGILKAGEAITATINRAGTVGTDARFARYGVKSAYHEERIGHNIPDVFWQFLNLSGPIVENGRQTTGPLSDPNFYVTGYPFSEAYWTTVKVAGQPNTDVLIQLYERRVLTYVPSAPEGWKVQMGNIGQHYYDWRYKGAGKPQGVLCDQAPPGPFGVVWSGNPTAQKQLGCVTVQNSPGIQLSPPTIALQHFERGHMIFYSQRYTTSHGQPYVDKHIFALYSDGTMQDLVDTYIPGTAEPTAPAPPPGLHAPTLGFGKVWREQQGVREKLGWATAPEMTPADAAIHSFEYGKAIYTGATERTIFALYNESGLSGLINRWALYPIPTQP